MAYQPFSFIYCQIQHLHETEAINLVSMKDAVKLSRRMKWLSPFFWFLYVVKHFHAVGGHYPLARFSTFRLSSLRPNDRGLKRQTLCYWQGSENCSDNVVQRTVNRILRGKGICFHLKVKHCYSEKRWLCWEVGMWFTEDKLHFDVWYMFLYW